MTLETAIEQNTHAIQQLISKLEILAAPNEYRRAKAVVEEPQIEPQIAPKPEPATMGSVTQHPSYKELTERLLTVSKINRTGAMAQLRKVMSEYDVTHVKDLAPEALPKVLNRFNELCGEIA